MTDDGRQKQERTDDWKGLNLILAECATRFIDNPSLECVVYDGKSGELKSGKLKSLLDYSVLLNGEK